ncbi:gld-4 [Acrasis kona]|uniref:Gld-4 n=1 Tax=Acrasis kona TaxID=1008807 RepID=A0AAW2Z3U5_9EUKA
MKVFNELKAQLKSLGLTALLYGSVVFETYLPGGDIDISIFVDKESMHEVPWYVKVENLLIESKKQKTMNVKDITFINAEIKLIKCVIEGMPIDLSANQTGGLSTLCFLTEVDAAFGKDHLFKKCVILLKAWCYFESRTLGSHHGLISSYGLTVLLMYIFNAYYEQINTPLDALLLFLDVYSRFDWSQYGVTLQGPILLQSLPELQLVRVDGLPEKLYLSEEFINKCKQYVQSMGYKVLTAKNLNVVDPLRDFNNLGRSVSRNNFLRIKRALTKGRETLKDITTSDQTERILTDFFKNSFLKCNGDLDDIKNQDPEKFLPKDVGNFFDTNLEECRNTFLLSLMLFNDSQWMQEQQQQQQQQTFTKQVWENNEIKPETKNEFNQPFTNYYYQPKVNNTHQQHYYNNEHSTDAQHNTLIPSLDLEAEPNAEDITYGQSRKNRSSSTTSSISKKSPREHKKMERPLGDFIVTDKRKKRRNSHKGKSVQEKQVTGTQSSSEVKTNAPTKKKKINKKKKKSVGPSSAPDLLKTTSDIHSNQNTIQ